ncbi:MAG: HEAT repeat domain-containing protein [Planctomycetota bacterium]
MQDSPTTHRSRIVQAYHRYLQGSDAIEYAAEVSRDYDVATLHRLLIASNVESKRAAALALAITGDRLSLPFLGRCLRDVDRGVRLVVDDAFRACLMRGPTNRAHHKLMQVMHLNDGGDYSSALPIATELCREFPNLAEAHHQAALAMQGLGRYETSRELLHACLFECRHHYMAWNALSRCRLEAGDLHGGLRALEISLAICPDQETIRLQVRVLSRRIGQQQN